MTYRTRSPSAAGRPGVSVPKKDAQIVLRDLTKRELLDREFRFKTETGNILIPTIRELSSRELSRLSKLAPGLRLYYAQFPKQAKPPRTLAAALLDQVPRELISEIPRSLDIIGDIAIFETPPKLLSYEKVIAEGVMRHQPSVRAVFAKAGQVSGEERVRPLRHLAGENRTETTHHEFGCTFKLDLAKVFFSPRLSTEHERVAAQVGRNETVLDMFAGIGPFSVLIAKRLQSVEVDAIDSNRAAVDLIRENARLNKVSDRVHAHNGNAREVVRELQRKATRVIMNHPSRANEFLGAALSALREPGGVLHYYRFIGGRDWQTKIKTEFRDGLAKSGYQVVGDPRTRQVREVAPLKWQVALDANVVRDG